MCEGRLVRDPTAPIYPTAIGGFLLIPGRADRPSFTLGEVSFGRMAMDAVFVCVPGSTGAPGRDVDGRQHRVVIQVRQDVRLRVSSVEYPSISDDVDEQIALCAFGDSPGYASRSWNPSETAYTWVQTAHFPPERVVGFDGRDERTNLDWRHSTGRPSFQDRGEPWFVDTSLDRSSSARYAAAGVHARPNGHPRGEIIYDSPDLRRAYADRLRSEPQIRLLETAVQFRTYLYRRPGGYHGLASQDPLALVEWRYSERWERASAGAEGRRTHTDVRVLRIRPNPPEPPSLDDAIREYPFG